MNAEQYRALVAKLEAINPSAVNEKADPTRPASMKTINGMNVFTNDPEQGVAEPAAEPAPVATNGSSYTGSVGTADNNPVPAADPKQVPTIEAATFSQAYAQAVKQKLKKFKWCGTYAVKAKPRPVQPQPAPPAPEPITSNPMGDFDPTAFNGQAAAR